MKKLLNARSGRSGGLFRNKVDRSVLLIITGLLCWFLAPTLFAANPDPFGDIGTVASDGLTLTFQVIGVILVLVGLAMILSSASNIIRGRATGGDLAGSFVIAAILLLIGIGFIGYGEQAINQIGGG